MGTTRRLLHPRLNPTGLMASTGVVYAGTLMIYNVVNHHGAWSTPVFVSLVTAVASLLARQVVTPVADPVDEPAAGSRHPASRAVHGRGCPCRPAGHHRDDRGTAARRSPAAVTVTAPGHARTRPEGAPGHRAPRATALPPSVQRQRIRDSWAAVLRSAAVVLPLAPLAVMARPLAVNAPMLQAYGGRVLGLGATLCLLGCLAVTPVTRLFRWKRAAWWRKWLGMCVFFPGRRVASSPSPGGRERRRDARVRDRTGNGRGP